MQMCEGWGDFKASFKQHWGKETEGNALPIIDFLGHEQQLWRWLLLLLI